ncbi:hypothetical protein RND71_013584 [Anisodus tanguticus]|uniref:CN hydrolase domain-containing protein n=1 Tax=Anisodus tanguticus TaxID=243964 RepID=A0AAE1S9P1_9SOLA|nr:hypothetical protein RND71_013584 [Anisodus tanguticus]
MPSISKRTASGQSCVSGPLQIPKITQLKVNTEKSANIINARCLIQAAAEQGASLILLPEMWNCPYSTDMFAKFAEDFNDIDSTLSLLMLSEVASSLGVTIIDFGRIGIGICHEIRFPELAMMYSARGAHLICYPGAFNTSTGAALWELEQRTRQDDSASAVDNQLYVASCSPSRDSASSYMIWGHSTVVGPMGEINAITGHEEAVLIAEIDYAAIQRTRESLPLESQRCDDIYQFVDLLGERVLGRQENALLILLATRIVSSFYVYPKRHLFTNLMKFGISSKDHFDRQRSPGFRKGDSVCMQINSGYLNKVVACRLD